MDITFRPPEKHDYKTVADIICETWKFDRFGSKQTVDKISMIYLADCLCNQNYTEVAVADGNVVGIIMVKKADCKHIPVRFSLMRIKYILQMIFAPEAKSLKGLYKKFGSADDELMKTVKTKFDAEISLFAVSKKSKGMGIGGILYSRLMEDFKNSGTKSFFLCTDSDCDYGFYDHKGLKCIAEKTFSVNQCHYTDFTFYIYSN